MSYNTELQNNNQELRGILEDVNELPEYPQVPTKTSELENDSGFITKVVSDLANYYTKSQTFTRDEINAKISAIPKFAISVVSSLPTSNISATTVYLVGGGSGNDLYTEYIYANGKWEILGAQTVDLTGYATETWVNTQLEAYLKQSELDAAINSALASIPDWAKQSSKPRYNANEVGAVAYTAQSLTEEQKAQARANIAALGKMDVSLGIASDGLIYLFVNGEPVGTGIPQGQSGDVFGYVDENNTIVLTGALPDGTYNIKYEMEDGSTVDIGDLVLDTNVYYSVTKNLTNCSISNSATQAIEGESYSATITANDGYELKSVTVTMGGAAVTVTNGVINIASVTGNIVITAVAEEVAVTPSYTNLLPSAIDTDGTPYNGGLGYIEGYRLSGSSATGVSKLAGCCASGYMPISSTQDVIRIKNVELYETDVTANRLTFYNSSKTKLYEVTSFHSNPGVTVNDGVYSAKPQYWENTTSVAYFRFSAGVISDDTIVTVNEEITENTEITA